MKPIYLINIVGAIVAGWITIMAIGIAIESSTLSIQYERAFEESRAMYEELQRTRGVIDSGYVCKKRSNE